LSLVLIEGPIYLERRSLWP